MNELQTKFEAALFDFQVAMKSRPESSQLPREIILRSEGSLAPQTILSIDKVVSEPPVVNVNVEPTPVSFIVNVPETAPSIINIPPAQISVNVPSAKAPSISPVINVSPTPVTIENQVNVPAQPIDLKVNIAGTTSVVKRNAMGQILEIENAPKIEVKK